MKLKFNPHLSLKKLNNHPTLNEKSHIKTQLGLLNIHDRKTLLIDIDRFFEDIQKQENHDKAFIEFSKQYGEPWRDDKQLKQLYKTHMSQIRDQEIRGRRTRTYLRYLDDPQGTLINNMKTIMKEIYHHQSHAFKINLSFSFILHHRETLEYCYFYASNNEQLLKSPSLIRNQQDLQNLLNHLAAKDFPSLLKEERPNTKWVIERFVNLRIHLIITTYPLGKPPKFPNYIKNNRHIIGLEKDKNTAIHYKDHLCFFRCLAIGKYRFTRHNCNRKAKELFQEYCDHFQVKPKTFEGVELDEFPELEKYFEVQLFAMFLKEDGSAKTLYLSQASFPTKIYMNVYQNHLSYIKDIKMHSKQYICNRCDKLFAEMWNLNKHQSKCDGTVKYVFPGGVYKSKLSVFEELEEMGVRVREEDKYEKWFAYFDLEAYQHDFDEKVDANEENSLEVEEGTLWNKVHVPVSFSAGCNVDGLETCHVSSKYPGELVSQFVAILLEMGEKKYRVAVERFEYIFDQLEQLKVQEMDRLEEANLAADDFLDDDDDVKMDNDDNPTNEGMKKLDKQNKRFEAYCKELVVFGFNSAGYDIKLIKKFLFKELCEHGQQPNFTVKKSGKYPCIKSESLKFLDVLQFLAPGYNLKSFFKAFGVTEQKGFFPYDYFTHADQLDETTLPPYDTSYSTIKGCNVLEEHNATFQKLIIQGKSEQEALQILRLTSKLKTGPENYQWLQQLWTENPWSTFPDFLKWYNDLDVTPMIQAVENMNEFYKQKHTDFHASSLSPWESVSTLSPILQQSFISLTRRIKIYTSCLNRKSSVVAVSFSIDTMRLVKPSSVITRTNHVRKSSAMMQMHFVFEP